MNRQVAAYTGPTPAEGVVKFFAAFIDPRGDFVVHVRNGDGQINEITIPRANGREIGLAFLNNIWPND